MTFPVSQSKSDRLERDMEKLGVFEKDLEEAFVHSGGPGGQNVNKVATCVVLKHMPTGIVIKCQKHRTQGMNRYRARVMLVEKLEAQILGKASRETQRIEKIRRQKRKRSKRAKEKVLKNKAMQSEKKELRKKPSGETD